MRSFSLSFESLSVASRFRRSSCSISSPNWADAPLPPVLAVAEKGEKFGFDSKKDEVVHRVEDVSLVDGVFEGVFSGDGDDDFAIGDGGPLTGKKKQFFAQLAHSAGPTCISYLAEEASDRLEFLPSWDSMDQDLLLLYGQYQSTLVDHMDVEKASHFDELETSIFHFYLPSSYLCFACSSEEFDLFKLRIPPK
ncbi:hypothetical protein Tco_0655298 [Tanacetum coccineum]|uniref:Ribosomal protein L10 n=1 Tax=Tanacetum coccineum TaxID=301880 RepID=A0ABQ4X5M8_9ASTR